MKRNIIMTIRKIEYKKEKEIIEKNIEIENKIDDVNTIALSTNKSEFNNYDNNNIVNKNINMNKNINTNINANINAYQDINRNIKRIKKKKYIKKEVIIHKNLGYYYDIFIKSIIKFKFLILFLIILILYFYT